MLSVTFLEKIAPTPGASTRDLLAAGWILLLGSLLAALVSHATSAVAFEQSMDHLAWYYHGGRWPSKSSLAARATGVLNVGTIICFVVDMAALVRFAYVNVQFKEIHPHGGSLRQTRIPAVTATAPGATVAPEKGRSWRDSGAATGAAKEVALPTR